MNLDCGAVKREVSFDINEIQPPVKKISVAAIGPLASISTNNRKAKPTLEAVIQSIWYDKSVMYVESLIKISLLAKTELCTKRARGNAPKKWRRLFLGSTLVVLVEQTNNLSGGLY